MLLSKVYRAVVLSLVVSPLCVLSLFAGGPGSTEPLRVGVFADLHAHDSDNPLEKLVMVT